MKKRLLCFITLLTATISATILTNNVKAATKWNTGKSVTKEENGVRYSAYLSEDGKESWIYQIKLGKKIKKLTLPKEINEAKLTRVGFGKELYDENKDAYQNLFGDTIEPWHNSYGNLSNDDKNKQTIETVTIPSSVNQMETAVFSGMKKLKSVVIPEQTASVPAYAFAKCSKLSKVTFSKNMNTIDGTAFVKSNQIKTFSCSKANKTFTVKKGMLTTKSGKTLVLVPNKMKKITIPSKVKIIDDKVSVMGKIGTKNEVHIPKSVNKVIESWMFYGNATVYFHGTKPPVIISQYKGYEYTALPIFNKVYVPKKAKKTYIKWAKDRDGLEWNNLHTF